MIPRLRLFAGPNGSGKSTLKELIPQQLLGIYVNADEIEKSLRKNGTIDFSEFMLTPTSKDLSTFFENSILFEKASIEHTGLWRLDGNVFYWSGVSVNSYHASVLSDFIRTQLVNAGLSFTFESVMSSPDKIEFLKWTREQGYRTYLYFVATSDPQINWERVQNRVQKGGHSVPQDKVFSRYQRSLQLLGTAITHSDRAYLFDNSGHSQEWIAEVTGGNELVFKTQKIPIWLQESLGLGHKD